MLTSNLKEIRDSILLGDSVHLAKDLPSAIARCIVTSPPYFGHRDYAGNSALASLELGKEENPDAYIARLIELFRELRRVSTPDGTLWLNLGDTYRDGQLLGIPWRTALEIQRTGWILRSEIIWDKPNAMPHSVKTRPTVSHEHIFLFSREQSYFYNADAIREPHVTFSPQSKMRGGRNHLGKRNSTPELGKNKGNSNLHDGRWDQYFHPLGRNKRTVWNIPLGKFRGAHFAVFPEKLVATCILAGSEPGDLILDPFMGSGTTALVSQRYGRHYLGLELIPAYAAMARARLINAPHATPLFDQIATQY